MMEYITKAVFFEEVPRDINVLHEWNALEDEEKDAIYYSSIETIDTLFQFVGKAIDDYKAFPRNFDDLISTLCSSDPRRAVLVNGNRKLPVGLDRTCIMIGREITATMDIKDVLKIKDKAGADKIKDRNVEIEIEWLRTRKWSNATLKYILPFMSFYFDL